MKLLRAIDVVTCLIEVFQSFVSYYFEKNAVVIAQALKA